MVVIMGWMDSDSNRNISMNFNDFTAMIRLHSCHRPKLVKHRNLSHLTDKQQ